jgi:uncharacterized protein YkwD
MRWTRSPSPRWTAVAGWLLALALTLPAPGAAEEPPPFELGPAPRLPEEARVYLDSSLPQVLAPGDSNDLAVDTTNRAAVVDFFNTQYTPFSNVPIEWTGNHAGCVAGTTSAAFADATLRRVNVFRAMAGLPGTVVLDPTLNAQTQDAALMMSAEGALSHFPPPTFACFTAAGDEAAQHSNLALGVNGAASIDLYIDDPGASNDIVGHRRWILFPRQVTMGTGSVPAASGKSAANALWVLAAFGPNVPTPDGVPWPPRGFLPFQLLPKFSGRWSFSFPNADFSAATVTMSTNGTNIPVILESLEDSIGFGDNTLVWRPQGIPTTAPPADTPYTVTVSNVLVGGNPQTFVYTTTVIDPAQTPTGTLTVQKAGAGAGTVTSNVAGISCGGDCTETYPDGTEVTLTAVAAAGSVFTGWSGGGCGGTGSCVVTVTGSVTVTATFARTFTLTVVRAGTGTGAVASQPAGIACGADCAEVYTEGQVVTLTATPAADSDFTGWTNCAPADGNPCTVTITANVTVTATFTLKPQAQFTLTVVVRGSGPGAVTGAGTYLAGTQVVLTATPGAGATFKAWGAGECDQVQTGPDRCTVTMNADRTVTATFSRIFTDAALAGLPVKLAHLVELRAAMATLRAVRSLAVFPLTDGSPTAGVTPVRSVHWDELRQALQQVRAADGGPPLTFGESVAAGQTVKGAHVEELRGIVRTLE